MNFSSDSEWCKLRNDVAKAVSKEEIRDALDRQYKREAYLIKRYHTGKSYEEAIHFGTDYAYTPKKCECGANHTSFPNFHSDYCPLYKVMIE